MIRDRRTYLPLIALLIALPLLATLVDRITGVRLSPAAEQQNSAAISLPGNLHDLRKLTESIDAGLRTGFGLRSAMIFAGGWIRYHLGARATNDVFIADSGRLFLLADQAVAQSVAAIRRDGLVDNTVDYLSRLKSTLDARGSRFVVAVPPNASTIYQSELPRWAQASGKLTEYDLLLAKTRSKGIAAIDLRPPLAELLRNGAEAYYKRDTHWTSRGMLAAHNEIMAATGRQALAIAAERALAPRTTRLDSGDLANLLGLVGYFSAEFEDPLLEPGHREYLGGPMDRSRDEGAFSVNGLNNAGPTIMIIGDSFTRGLEIFARRHAARVIWQPLLHCAFDWSLVETVKPDEVWWMPTERNLNCEPDAAAKLPDRG